MTHPNGSGDPQESQGDAQSQADSEGLPASPTEPEYIHLRADQLHAEIARLERDNEDFARLFNTRIGDKAAKKYQPQLEDRDRKIEDLNRELRRRDILSMDEEEIETKFASDPEFAREYAELVHYQPPAQDQSDETTILTAVNEAFDWARSQGLDDETIAKVQRKAANEEYDREGESWVYSLQRMQQDLSQEIVSRKTSTPDPPRTNPNLGSGPDLTPSNRQRGSVSAEVPKTIAEFKALPTSRQYEILDDPEGLAAVEELAKRG